MKCFCYLLRTATTITVVAAVILVAGAWSARAANGICAPSVADNKWHYSLTPYMWLASINGTVAAQGKSAEVDAGVDEIIRHLNWMTEAHIEARKGDLGFYIDPTYVKLSVGGSSNGNPASVGFREWLIDFAATYRVLSAPFGDAGGMQSVDLIAGGRYWNLNASVDVVGGGSGSKTRQWADPIVGARYTGDLSRNWSLLVQGDVGGFGVSSDFTWSVAPLLFYRVTSGGSIVLGYRALGVDYTTGSTTDLFKLDATYSGPILGYEFAF